MSTAYSHELYLEHAVSSSGFTVDVDQTWVIRTITLFWPGGSVGPLAQLVDVLTGATIYWHSDAISSVGTFQIEPDVRIVLPAASAIDVIGFGDPDIGLYGYKLSLP